MADALEAQLLKLEWDLLRAQMDFDFEMAKLRCEIRLGTFIGPTIGLGPFRKDVSTTGAGSNPAEHQA